MAPIRVLSTHRLRDSLRNGSDLAPPPAYSQLRRQPPVELGFAELRGFHLGDILDREQQTSGAPCLYTGLLRDRWREAVRMALPAFRISCRRGISSTQGRVLCNNPPPSCDFGARCDRQRVAEAAEEGGATAMEAVGRHRVYRPGAGSRQESTRKQRHTAHRIGNTSKTCRPGGFSGRRRTRTEGSLSLYDTLPGRARRCTRSGRAHPEGAGALGRSCTARAGRAGYCTGLHTACACPIGDETVTALCASHQMNCCAA